MECSDDHTDTIGDVFASLNDWRHLPNYQLERRVDIFFSLYLVETLTKFIGEPIADMLIPEFPLKVSDGSNRSVKMDYAAFNEKKTKFYLIELKTDVGSISQSQFHRYSEAAKCIGKLFDDLIKIAKISKQTNKYLYLLNKLKNGPNFVETTHDGGWETTEVAYNLTGESVLIAPCAPPCTITNKRINHVITFSDISNVVKNYSDPLSRIFYESIQEWIYKP